MRDQPGSAGSYYVHRPHRIVAFDVLGGRHLGSPRLFAVTIPGFPDGIKVDSRGRVFASALSGVQVFDPDGTQLGEIHLPGAVNFTFGGPERNVGVAPVVAVVDAGGELLHLWRPDAAQVASVGVATDKARTAALYRRPSEDFEDQAAIGAAVVQTRTLQVGV